MHAVGGKNFANKDIILRTDANLIHVICQNKLNTISIVVVEIASFVSTPVGFTIENLKGAPLYI